MLDVPSEEDESGVAAKVPSGSMIQYQPVSGCEKRALGAPRS